MNMPLPPAHGIQESCLILLRELSDSLALGQAALLASDLESFDLQTIRQQDVCLELLHLQSLMKAHNPAEFPGSNLSPGGQTQSAARSRELRQAESQLWQQARLYAAVLRRARRTVEIFCRVLASSGTTYAAPSAGR
jgi:hypothetical protein